jgi:hypothetical protein
MILGRHVSDADDDEMVLIDRQKDEYTCISSSSSSSSFNGCFVQANLGQPVSPISSFSTYRGLQHP